MPIASETLLTLIDLLRRRVRENPARRAFTFLDASGNEAEALTWAGLDERARAVAAALERAGEVGERALLLHPPGLGFITSFLGCLYAGTVAVPAYPPGRNRAPARLRSVAADAGARVVLAPAGIAAGAEGLAQKAPELAGAVWIATDEIPPAAPGIWDRPAPGPDEPAFLQYTSGSTSDPKGVVVTHGNLMDNEEAIRLSFEQSEASVVVGWLPLYHDMGLIGNVLQPLYTGGQAVLMAPLTFLERPVRWLEAISRYRATTSGGPSFAYELCARKVSEEEKDGLDLSSWAVAFNGAEPVRAETLDRFAAAFARCGFQREAFLPCYGLAEATLFVSGGRPAEPPVVRQVDAAELERGTAVEAVESGRIRTLVSSGRAAPGLEVRIADPEILAPLPPGQVGEVLVAGPSVAAGYWRRPEETERIFGARLAGGEGLYLRTGDLGFLAGGELFVTGRLKDLIILRGRNHYPQDFERTAEGSHPALRAGGGAAFSVERGGEERLVILHEVERSQAAEGGLAEIAAIAAAIERAVAVEHEVAVEEVVLLRRGTLLKTSSGKVRRAASRDSYLAGDLAVVFRSGRPEGPSEDRESRGGEGLREVLTAEAARVLRRGGIDPDAPLTALGLDSLAATELRSAVEERTGVAVSLSTLLEGISLSALEAEVRAAGPVDSGIGSGSLEPDSPGEHPLSAGQRALWLVDRLNPASAALHLAGAALVPGGMDGAALRRALAALAARHPGLRTAFEPRGGEPVRRVEQSMDPDFVEGAASEAALPELLVAEAYHPFEVEHGPLLRVRLWHLPGGDAALLVCVHHLIADYPSVAVLLRDLMNLYRQERGGSLAALTPAGPGTTAWLRRREEALAGPRGERLRAWWHARLAGELPVLDLPADRPRPVARTWRGTVRTARVEGAAEALRQLGRRRGATLFAGLLAAFQTVLLRWTGQDEVLVGAPAAGRGPGLEGEIGYFVNPVVLRLGVAGEPAFGELVEAAGTAALEAFEHGDYPFPRLARELVPDQDPERSPLFQAMLVLQPSRSPEERALAAFALGEDGVRAELGGVELVSVALPEARVQAEVTLMAAESGEGGLALSLQLDADLFEEATAARLLGHLSAFLQAAAADPERPALEIDFLSEAERRQLAAWGAGPPAEPPGPCLPDLIAAQAARTPAACALVHGEERTTYEELWSRAGRLAAHLRSLGVGPEVRVGICSPRTPRLMVGLLAILESGGTYVPLDPAYPAERLAYLIEDSQAALLLVDRRVADRLPADGPPRVWLDEEPPEPFGCEGIPRRASPENLSHLIYTSGSTGRPKAVMIRHRSVAALAHWAREAFSARELDGILASTSVGFDISVFEILVPLCWGGRVVLAGNALDLPDLPPSAEIRLVNTVPSVMTELLRAGTLPASVETVNLAGEPVRQELVNALFAAGARRVTNLYGPSEDTTYSTIAELRPADAGEPSIGRPVAGTRARILDRRMGQVPPGVAGELFLGGEGLARGYLGRPDLTAERFVPSPFPEDGPGARLYRTGDRVRWRPDGELAFLGRLDFQVKIRGFRIELGEVETVLSAHPEVRQAVVLVMEEARDRRLVAYVAADIPLEPRDLRGFLAEHLPEHMIPSAFVVLESLPLNANGKVDRRALARLAPDREIPIGQAPPRTPLEATLVDVWGEVLGGPVGIHDNFFELGGHSLLALRAQARIRERLGADVPLAALFRAPTIARLAPAVAAALSWQLPPPAPRPRTEKTMPSPLSFAQERLWLLHRLRPASPVYHVAAEVRLRGPLHVPALAAAFQDLVRRHEALRTRFPEAGDHPVQVVDPDRIPDLPVVCLAGVPLELREAEAERLAGEEAARPFDLAAAPPTRARLLRVGENEHRLLLTFHHIAVDEASLGLLAHGLAQSYEALAQGRPSPLVSPRLQVADVAVWERERAEGDALAARLAWWEERLANLPPLRLPSDAADPLGLRSDRGGSVTASLAPETAAALAVLARAEGATPFMALLAGFQAFLSRLSGALDFAVGSPFATRGHPDLEGVVGPLLNTLVLRVDLDGDPSFRELLRRVREGTLAAHERADVPLDLLVERLRPERGPGGANLLFTVLFALQRPPGVLRAAGVELEARPVPTETAKFDLTLFVQERGEGIGLELEYAADLWERGTAVRLLDSLLVLLRQAAADPAVRLSELQGFSESGRRQILLEARPAPVSRPLRGGPRTPVEELLAGIWEDLLGVERPGIDDDFFAAGGHSLLAARASSRLRGTLGVDLPLSAFFEERTLAGQAARVEAALAAREGGAAVPLVPIPREDHPEGLPLSFGQERLWFLDRLEPGNPVYNMPLAARLDGDLDVEALRAALAGIVSRHEVLSSRFAAPAGTPLQRGASRLDLQLPQVDLAALPSESRQAESLRVSQAEALRPFDLETGPPLRATLLRLAEREHVLLVTVHHIAFDGWSIGVFLTELAAFYAGGADLPPLPVQYADFAVWQRRLLESEALEPRLAWWRERLAGAPPVLALPLDRPRPPVQTFRGGHLHRTLGLDTVRGVRELARRQEATPFMVCLAVWAVLLARYGAEEDVVVGTAVAGRNRVELEPLIGLLAENLVLRLDLAGDPAFPEILARTRETVLAAWAHQGIPFERLVRELRPERDLSHTPLYQTVLTLDASDRPPLELPGLRLRELPVDGGTSKFDLSLYLQDRGGEITGLLEYNRDLFDPGTAARLLAAFERLLAAVPEAAERRVSELPVLSEGELRQVTSGGLVEAASGALLVPAIIAARAASDPGAPAVTGAKGETLSYGELDRAAARLARRLRALGVGPEVPVAVCLDRSPELIVAMLAVWKAGGVYVPLDPVHPEERLAWMAADSGAAVVLASRRGAAPSPAQRGRVGEGVLFLEDIRAEEGSPEPPAPLFPESAAYLIYTSGSTGRPKGVVVTHGALAAYVAAASDLYGFGPGDRILQSASPGFDLSLDEIIPCLTGGAELVMRDDAMLSSASAFLEGCRARGITGVSLPTALFHEIASGLEQEGLVIPSALRLVILGGERLLPERLEAWRRRFPDGPRLLNTYGPTEATIIVTAADVTTSTSREAPLGRPLPGAGVWLLGRWGEPVPPGVSGEIAIGGDFLARGYHGQPDRTAERFVPHPFPAVPGARLYRTGDLARRLSDGTLEFAGRIDAQIKVRGYRVEPGELEAALVRHPGVAAAAVGVWDDRAGHKRLVGYVVPRPEPASRPTAAEIRAFLAASLPEPLLPSELVFLEALPLNAHGKVDRKALPPPSNLQDRLAAAEHVPPRDEAERAIAEVWREVLNVERIGVHDPFFDLGGHSLALARVHVLLGERLGREVPLVDLFRHPTVASLAKHLSQAASPVSAGAAVTDEPPAVRAQERADRSRTATRQGRFLEARKRLPPPAPARPAPVPAARSAPAPAPAPAAPWPATAEAAHARLSRASAAFLRYAASHPELLDRASFAELERQAAVSPYPLQPWPALVDRARAAEMERVSTGLVRLVKSLPRRVFADDPERLRDFYGLPSAGLVRSMIEEPNGLAGAVGRGDFLESSAGLQCLELNLVSDLGGWQAPLWAEGYLRVPAFARFLAEKGLRVACRDTVALLFEHVVREALELGRAHGELNVALVLPEGAVGQVSALEPWLAARYAEVLRRAAPSMAGALSLLSYPEVREGGGGLWAGGRRIHAAVEVHQEGTAAPAYRAFRAGNLKLYNAPVRTILTDKRNLALLSELAERGEVLSGGERELVRRHVPWTRRLAAGTTGWKGSEVHLPEHVLAARQELVIKRAREGQGAAVHLGAATPEPVWRELVTRALADGDWVVQERVRSLPYVHQLGERGWGLHDVVWGLFVFGDRYGGAFLSLSPRGEAGEGGDRGSGVVNLTRGASAGVVFEVLDDAAD